MLTDYQKEVLELAGIKLDESLGEDNSTLDDAGKAKSTVIGEEEPVQEEPDVEITDRCKEIIKCIDSTCLPYVEEQYQHFSKVDEDDENRGRCEFYERIIDALRTIKSYVEDEGEVGIKRASHFLTSLMSPMQHEIPGELWELLTEKPTSSLSRKYSEIDTRAFAESVEADYDTILREREESKLPRLTDEELDFAYGLVKGEELTVGEINELAEDNAVDFGRSSNSLSFVLRRMHSLVHGKIPLNASYSPGWFDVPKRMVDWADRNGIPAHRNLVRAEAEAKERASGDSQKISKEAALEKLVGFYQSNKNMIPSPLRTKMVDNRSAIVDSIMNGSSVEAAIKDVTGVDLSGNL